MSEVNRDLAIPVDRLVPNGGVCALLEGRQVAVFYLPSLSPSVYAIDNRDPLGNANVLSRGIVGDIDGEPVVASPLYKQHFSLRTGRCVEDEAICIPVHDAVLQDDQVTITISESEST